MIAEILFFVSIVGLIVAAINCTEDWSGWVGGICGAVAITCIFFGMYKDEQKPKEIRTKQPPQIDTIIEIRNSIPDTSYVYRFYKEGKQ